MRLASPGWLLTVACCVLLAGCEADEEGGVDRGDGSGGAPSPAPDASVPAPGGTGGDSALAGQGGESADAGTCGIEAAADANRVSWRLFPAWTPIDYAGPAVVERSTPHELVLYVAAAPTGSGGTGAGEAPIGARNTVSATGSLPLLPPGSELWLFQSDEIRFNGGVTPPATRGPRLAVRAREGGALIVGAVRDRVRDENTTEEPLSFTQPVEICTEPNGDQCVADGRRTHYSVAAQADTVVRAAPGARTEIQLGGIDYDLDVLDAVRESMSGSLVGRCADFYGYSEGVWIDASVTPKRPSDVTVEVQGGGNLPECVLGNDPIDLRDFGFYEVSISTAYEGTVTYTGTTDGEMRFSLAGGVGTFHFTPLPGVAAPAVGDELWLSATYKSFALKQSESGPLLRAEAWSFETPPLTPELADQLSRWLGVPVTMERRCEYAAGLDLYDTLFATDPPVRVPPGSTDQLMLDGGRYDVATHMLQDLWFVQVVQAAP